MIHGSRYLSQIAKLTINVSRENANKDEDKESYPTTALLVGEEEFLNSCVRIVHSGEVTFEDKVIKN